jgi:tRNA dimethylallyltransferase
VDTEQPVIIIAGQTASGKTDLTIKLAKKYRGEIICADSRTIYRELNIGTAKPTLAQRNEIPHHGLDLIDPDKRFSAAQFKKYAEMKIRQIHSRENIAFIVGGSGLYIDALAYDYKFAQKGAARDEINLRHLKSNTSTQRQPLNKNFLYIGLNIEKEALTKRIVDRVDSMFDAGLVEETEKNVKKYGLDAPGLLAPGYRAVVGLVNDELSLIEAKQLFIKYDLQLAKRQKTWFKRNIDMVWVKNYSEAQNIVSNFLKKFDTI